MALDHLGTWFFTFFWGTCCWFCFESGWKPPKWMCLLLARPSGGLLQATGELVIGQFAQWEFQVLYQICCKANKGHNLWVYSPKKDGRYLQLRSLKRPSCLAAWRLRNCPQCKSKLAAKTRRCDGEIGGFGGGNPPRMTFDIRMILGMGMKHQFHGDL